MFPWLELVAGEKGEESERDEDFGPVAAGVFFEDVEDLIHGAVRPPLFYGPGPGRWLAGKAGGIGCLLRCRRLAGCRREFSGRRSGIRRSGRACRRFWSVARRPATEKGEGLRSRG